MTKPRLSAAELRSIFAEYLRGLSDEDDAKYERFTSPRGYAETTFEDFMEWFESRESSPVEPSEQPEESHR